MQQEPIIGVVGGMGPYAGIDLVQKIFDETLAESDQEHLPVTLVSYAHRIRDRSSFILGQDRVNPAPGIAEALEDLGRIGATVAGMPCNSAHAPIIFEAVLQALDSRGTRLRLLNLITEALTLAQESVPGIQRIGPLSTFGLHTAGLYRSRIAAAGLTPVMPAEDVAENVVHRAIFDPVFGIKAHSNPVPGKARDLVLKAVRHLKERGAEAVILGCTELPLAVGEARYEGIPLIDSTRALARGLIRETYPEKLRPLAIAG